MARKRSAPPPVPKKTKPRPLPLPPPVSTRKKSYMREWHERHLSGEDSDRWAKLELQLGRFAQVASVASGLVLVFAVSLASILASNPNPPLLANLRRPLHMVLWFPLLATSFAVAGFTVAKKLGPYRMGFRSAHFLSSLGAFAVSIVFLVLALLDHLYVIDLAWLALWMYPASVLGLSLAFVSLAMTWEGLGLRKGASIVASLALPISMVIVPLVGVADESRITPGLTFLFAYNAIFIVVAGSLLHLIASAGEAQQREILKASDTKVTLLKQDMANKLRVLEYRERAYVEREAHLEAKDKELRDLEGDLEARAKELNGIQARMDAQGKGLADLESRLAKMRAEVEAKVEEFNLKEKQVAVVRTHVEEAQASLGKREAALAEREKEIKRTQIDVASRERAVEAKASQLGDLDARVRKDAQELDARREDVIRRQKELELKESEVKLKIEQLEAQQTTEIKAKMAQLRDWESKVLGKERELATLEISVRQAKEELDQQRTDADAYAAALAQEREALDAREQEFVAREKEFSDREAGIHEKESEIDRQWKELRELQQQLSAREEEYNALFKDAKLREADFVSTKEDVSRRLAQIEAREAKLREWQGNLSAETKRIQDKYREILSREKSLEAKESEISLRELEMTTKEREAPAAPAAGILEADTDKVYELREKALREREEEFKRRMYQKEKELEAREMAMREQLKALAATAPVPGGEAVEATVEVSEDAGTKLKTGTPRLDDLLYGGFPLNANVLFVGPSFLGKEIAILNFIAEGLRASAPAIIVTTSKPPVEIAKDMAPVLPTFLEYEQLGLVRWIDASGTTPTQKLARDGHTYLVPNATDFDGIVEAIDRAEEEFRLKNAQYFRFAFLTLSSSTSQTDDKTAMAFVQRLANRLRQSKCVAAFALERGMHTDQQLESLQQLMDGAIHFQRDKGKTTLSVAGIGEVQTRDWVPYKFTNKALMIGSFQLERIR